MEATEVTVETLGMEDESEVIRIDTPEVTVDILIQEEE